MRRTLAASLAATLLLVAVGVVPAVGGTRQAVTMTVITLFDPAPDAFSATGLPDCESGWVTDGPAKVVFTPAPGIFAGFKQFDCGSDTGFVVRLNARFGPDGAVGTWSVVAAWGSLAGMSGAGMLTGEPIEGGIIDSYSGTVTL